MTTPMNDREFEIDRNARAFGWEVGRGQPIATILRKISDNNPFMDPDWRDNIGSEPEEGGLVTHAKRELALAGNDEDFNQTLIEAVRAFASYGHSGGSASVAIPMLNDLLQFKNLTPLTSDPNEWNNVSDASGYEMWQSQRNSEAFSTDGGKTYYLLSECVGGTKTYHTSVVKNA